MRLEAMEKSNYSTKNKTEETFLRLEDFFDKMARLPQRERAFFADILEGIHWFFLHYEKDGYHKGYDPLDVERLYKELGSPKNLREFAFKANDWAEKKNGNWDDFYTVRILEDFLEEGEEASPRSYTSKDADNSALLTAAFDDMREFFFHIVSLPEPERAFFVSIIFGKITDLILSSDEKEFRNQRSRFTGLYFESGAPENLKDFAALLHKQIVETGRPHLEPHDVEVIERLIPNSGYTEEILVERFMDEKLPERERINYMEKLCAHFPEAFTRIVNNSLEEILVHDVSVNFVNTIIDNIHRKRIPLTNKLENWRSLRRYSKRVRYAINTPDDDYRKWQQSGELDK